MADSSKKFSVTGLFDLTGKTPVVAIVLLLHLLFLFFLHLYAKHFRYRRRQNPNTTARRLDLSAGGLDPSLLQTLPALIFDPKEFENGLDCPVCLSEISRGEKIRFLPKCNHGFHLHCIDTWFESHSTCPLCRAVVRTQNRSNSGDDPDAVVRSPAAEFPIEALNFPTNVLIWGDETRVRTFGPPIEENGDAIVEISSSSSSSVRSLKKVLIYNPSSPRNLDIEQGGRG